MEETRPRPSRRTLWLLVTPIVVLSVAATVANALTPTLVKEHPLALIALEPRGRNLIAVARRVDLLPFMLVAVFRRFLSDPLYVLLGRYYGNAAVRWIERKSGDEAGFVKSVERAFAKWSSPLVFLWPGALVCVLAGETGMRPKRFVVLNVLGTLFTATVIRLLAEVSFVKDGIDAVLRFNDRNFKWLTAITIGLVVIWAVGQRRQGKDELSGLEELEAEIEGEERGEAEERSEPQ